MSVRAFFATAAEYADANYSRETPTGRVYVAPDELLRFAISAAIERHPLTPDEAETAAQAVDRWEVVSASSTGRDVVFFLDGLGARAAS